MQKPMLLIKMLLGSLATAVSCAVIAQGTGYPTMPITVVVPFAAGGGVDVAARIVMPKLGERLKQNIVIENTVGASGTIATQRVIRAKPDGYTMLFGVASPVTVAPLVSPSIYKYDGLKELTPVASVAAAPFVLIGRPTLAAQDTAELIKLISSQPGKLNYGTDGVGTSLHVTAEMIKHMAGLDIVHVPYKSGPQVLTELAGGQIDLAVLPIGLAQNFIRDNKVKAYGVTGRQRWQGLPSVPSLSETAELKGLDVDSWLGLLAPAGMDHAIVDRISKELAVVLAEPDMVRKLADAGLKPMLMAPEQFANYLAKEKQDLAAVISSAKIRMD
jgi:tripartite-type tricarboxylate transporter receptor subunit TctC